MEGNPGVYADVYHALHFIETSQECVKTENPHACGQRYFYMGNDKISTG